MSYRYPLCPSGGKTLLLLFLTAVSVVFCSTTISVAAAEGELRVGVREVRPFIFLDENQRPSGYSIDLWEEVAGELNLEHSFVVSDGISYTLEDMKEGRLDIAIGAITITEEREKIFDFSYSHFHTGLGIMTRVKSEYSISAFFSSFFTTTRLLNISGFVLFLLVSAHVIWLTERRGNFAFHRSYFPGIFEGIYWSIVTASTVGYGDYVPKSKLGKILSVVIIIISLPLFGLFIANVSSYITLQELRSDINGPQDLAQKRVGVVKGSTSDAYLAGEQKVIAERYASSTELFSHLQEGGPDAIVHDLPTLHYYANTDGKGRVRVVGKMFKKQDYAFLYPENSSLTEPVNRALLKLYENGTLATIRTKWFGDQGGG